MPVPRPNSGERQPAFVQRCYKEISKEYPRAQSFAICYNAWRDRNK